MSEEKVKIIFLKCGMLPGKAHWTKKEMPAGAVVEVDKEVADRAIKKGIAKLEKRRRAMDAADLAELREKRADELFKEKMAKIEAAKNALEG